jgi:hypothetical protein
VIGHRLLEIRPQPRGQPIRDRHVAREVDRDPLRGERVEDLLQLRLDPLGLVGDHLVVEAGVLDRIDVVGSRDGDATEDAVLESERERAAGTM